MDLARKAATCIVCDGSETTGFVFVNGKQLSRCDACGLIFAHPRPTAEEVTAYYSAGYYDPYLAAREANAASHGAALDEIEKRSTRGRLLDVGCGIGLFLKAARARGWEVEGVDPSPWPAGYAREESRVPVRTQSLEEAAFPDNAFDVVTFWSTVEHLSDPLRVLREARRVVRPGGSIWIAVPNTNSLGVFLHGENEHNLAKPEHLFHFTAPNLWRLLEEGVVLTDVERVFLWGDRQGLLRNAFQHLARRTRLGSEIRMVARKPLP